MTLVNRYTRPFFLGLGFLVCVAPLLLSRQHETPGAGIALDQVGYRPPDNKIAFVQERYGAMFEIVDLATHEPVFRGPVGPHGVKDPGTGDMLYALDFSELTRPGRYRLRLPNTSIASDAFEIDEKVYEPAMVTAIESFYAQRCGAEVRLGTHWHHPACHADDAVFFGQPGRMKPVAGGWHDAGDYGKFVVTGALSAAMLLTLYELRPQSFSDGQLAIPEQHNGIPDLLDEARWELQWLLTMQREDGGVYHKVSKKKWTGEYLPHRDPDPRYIFDVSSAATGAFAAVAAQGAYVFSRYDPVFSQSLLRAAVNAWGYLKAHEDVTPAGGFKNPSGVEGGEYGDQRDADERLWAAVELYRLTGSTKYHAYFLENYRRLCAHRPPLSWQHVQSLAFAAYLHLPPLIRDKAACGVLREHMARTGDRLLLQIEQNGYRVVLNPNEYYWGSNSVALGYAFDLIQAYEATGQRVYREGALDQLHYVLGRNTFALSFVTGVGARPVSHPYHQFSMLLGNVPPVPGMMAGGPNRHGRLNGRVLSPFPGRCYEDNAKNYYVNETAINYTAPFVFLAGYFSPLRPPATTELGKAQ